VKGISKSIGSMHWSPLAAGLVARPWGDKSTTRGAENPVADMFGRPLF
jgi:1-deoxyxylulose-5-phosphate synthase